MTISGLTPTSALPMLANGQPLAGSNPLLAGQPGLPGGQLLGAQMGVVERPGIGSRLMSAMRAAIGELRGQQPQPQTTQLAMQATQPVAVRKPAAAPKRAVKAKTWTDKAGNLRQVGTGKILKPAAGAGAAPATTLPTTGVQPGAQLPTNATQLPGATVYSYDQNGNPVAPTMQQLGITPTMLQGINGAVGAVDPDGAHGPQLNATNQTNVGAGNGTGFGSAVPVLGQPILVGAPAATSPGDTPPATPHNGSGGTQSVTNRNETDVNSRNQGLMGGWGSGWGDPTGGIATPMTPYGSSMTGAYALGTGSRWF